MEAESLVDIGCAAATYSIMHGITWLRLVLESSLSHNYRSLLFATDLYLESNLEVHQTHVKPKIFQFTDKIASYGVVAMVLCCNLELHHC